MRLSKRLEAIYDLVPNNAIVADIGTDHGLLIIKCLLEGKSNFAYGIDVAKMPLEAAEANVQKYDLMDKVSLQLSDGLKQYSGNADCFVLAGMGAETIWGIIDAYVFKTDDLLIIQSNTKLPWLRKTLSDHAFAIQDEVFMMDRKIPTYIMTAKKVDHNVSLSDEEAWIGPVLLKTMNPEYQDFLASRMKHLDTIKIHDQELEKEFQAIRNIL